ncbi:hypothetical protein DTL21_18790 [Bremerella cremea]|uniref:Uncharacterized protein n=1 Tax=Blastopirellula marina TaxID=124 RepID=A0A2S8FJF5_9BACT|nr:hypothetical protein C5Y83_18770 [Blastopirellula marina]RCS45340.1 hypothetical protein DTL21_18790 [Bremerella cremea]
MKTEGKLAVVDRALSVLPLQTSLTCKTIWERSGSCLGRFQEELAFNPKLIEKSLGRNWGFAMYYRGS